MRRLSHLLPVDVMKSLFYSTIYCHYVYALPVWSSAGKTSLSKMDRLMNRAVSLLPSVPNQDNFTANRILNFNKSITYFSLVQFFKIYVAGNHDYIQNKITSVQHNHSHNTRFQSEAKLYHPMLTKSKCQKSFTYRAIKYWNELPCDIRNCTTLSIFKSQLKKHLLETVNTVN